MDRIRTDAIAALQDDFVSKGDNYNCWDRANYLLPCPCIISRYPGELPLDIVHARWRFEIDESKYDCTLPRSDNIDLMYPAI